MYVTISGNNYPAKAPHKSFPMGLWWQITLIDEPGLETPVSGEIGVYSDDGFELCTVDSAAFEREIYEDGVLTFTNQPAPEPEPEPTEEELEAIAWRDFCMAKAEKIKRSKSDLAKFLEDNPLVWIDGERYSVTEEKQSLLTSQLALQTLANQAGVERELKWNSTGGVCTTWSAENLASLALAIGAYVQPLVTYQQQLEVALDATESMEELDAIVIDYASAVVFPEYFAEPADPNDPILDTNEIIEGDEEPVTEEGSDLESQA